MSSEAAAQPLAQLLAENHQRFLAFLEERVESRAAAEEILQQAFVKGLERGDSLRDGESAIAWFYRLLRNALVDHYRRRAAEGRALDRHAQERLAEDERGPDPALERTVCQCVGALVDTLKPEYAQILRAVDVDGRPVVEVANESGITQNNASVRLHRARKALRTQVAKACGSCATHGCLDCSCSGPASGNA